MGLPCTIRLDTFMTVVGTILSCLWTNTSYPVDISFANLERCAILNLFLHQIPTNMYQTMLCYKIDQTTYIGLNLSFLLFLE